MTSLKLSLHPVTLTLQLDADRWWTPGMLADYLRQCGPLAFHTREEHDAFHRAAAKRQYGACYSGLKRLARKGRIDTALGDDVGREVRVFRLLAG